MVEGECCHTLKKLAQEVEGYQVHWGVRDSCYSRRVRLHNPMVKEPYTVNIESDWKEPLLREAPPLLPDMVVCFTYSWDVFPVWSSVLHVPGDVFPVCCFTCMFECIRL